MQPAYLYKYCSYTNPFHLELLFLNYIYFCSFEKLNDPFEGNFYTRLDLVPNEQLKEFLKQLLEHQGIKISDPKLEKYLDTQKEYFKNPEKIRENTCATCALTSGVRTRRWSNHLRALARTCAFFGELAQVSAQVVKAKARRWSDHLRRWSQS